MARQSNFFLAVPKSPQSTLPMPKVPDTAALTLPSIVLKASMAPCSPSKTLSALGKGLPNKIYSPWQIRLGINDSTISSSDCPPANSTHSWDTSYWPLQTRREAGNSSKSRSFPVLAEGLAHYESSNPHFLVYLWPYVLVLVLAWIAAPLSSCQLFYSTTLISGTMAVVLGPFDAVFDTSYTA